MDFQLTEEQRMIRDMARDFAEYSSVRIARSNINTESRRLRKYWESAYPGEPPPAKPAIDLFVVQFDEFTDIELKNVREVKANGRKVVSHPYYAGLGQALALFRFGFDFVQLWHCFRDEITDKVIAKSMRDTWQLIYDLKLPIGFAGHKVSERDRDFSMSEVHVSFGDPPPYEYDKPPDPARFWVETPLRDTPEWQKIREFISHILRIPAV
jgi:hypothetical protein